MTSRTCRSYFSRWTKTHNATRVFKERERERERGKEIEKKKKTKEKQMRANSRMAATRSEWEINMPLRRERFVCGAHLNING